MMQRILEWIVDRIAALGMWLFGDEPEGDDD